MNKASARRVATDVRRIETPKRGGMRPTNTQLGCGFPPGFGLRQSSAAFPPTAQPPTRCRFSILDKHLLPKRQRTAAVQNAIARLRPPSLIGPFVGRFTSIPESGVRIFGFGSQNLLASAVTLHKTQRKDLTYGQ